MTYSIWICCRKLNAFVLEYPMAVYHASQQRDCGLKIIKTKKGKGTWSIVSRKGWTLQSTISQRILNYKESSYFTELNKKWTQGACANVKSGTTNTERFSIRYFGGLITILICSFGVTFLIMLLETLCDMYMKKYLRPETEDTITRQTGRPERMENIEIISFWKRNYQYWLAELNMGCE